MRRLTSKESPFTLLQQRLQYIAQHPERNFTSIIENVPQWPTPIQPIESYPHLISEYAPCNGYDYLLTELTKRDRQQYKMDIHQDNILITNGAMHALSLIFRSLYQPGGIALVQAPVLANITDILKASGYEIVYFSSDPSEMMEQIIDFYSENVRFIYVNTPHNPFGGILSKDLIRKLVNFAQSTGIALVTDMIYDSYTFDENVVNTPLVESSNWQQIYTVNSMSKNYGAPGLRIGWITSDLDNIKKLSGLCEAECVAVSGLSQLQAYVMIQKGNQDLIEIVHHRKVYIEQRLAKMENIQYKIPMGGTQFFVKLFVNDIDLFADFMLVEYGLALTTTSNYEGVKGSYIRIPIVQPVELIDRALTLLENGIQKFSLLEKTGHTIS